VREDSDWSFCGGHQPFLLYGNLLFIMGTYFNLSSG
jgi:hypothetical protein